MSNKLTKSLAFLAIMAFIVSGCSKIQIAPRAKILSLEEAKAKVEAYINSELMAPGTKATITSVTDENGLYKVVVDIGQGQAPIDSYMTKDGSTFFPQGMEIKTSTSTPSTVDQAPASNNAAPSATVPKKAKATVELFVMSYCPYGTQIEKGILPAIKALGDKVDFQLKFCDYAMHGQKELTENMVQTCIEQGQPTKLAAYLECFLQKGEGTSDACIATAKVNAAKVKTCVASMDKQYKITENATNQVDMKGSYPSFPVFAADNTKYNVGGSPTLIINGVEASSARDSASLLKAICSGFTTAPAECQAALSSAAPAAGFGTATASGSTGSGAACGN